MAYINPQLQIDQQQQQRSDGNYKAIGDAVTDGLKFVEENRIRALAQKRQQEIDAQTASVNKLNTDKLTYEANQRALPTDQRDSFKEKSMLQKLKGDNKASDLATFEQKEQIRSKYRQDKDANAIDNVAQKKITENNVTLFNVKNAMDEALTVLNDPNIPEDQKTKTGQSLYKLLNSAEGSDAVGAEEAKRLGSYLEYNILNLTQPGAVFGRDLKGFTDQVGNYSKLLGGRITRNESTAQGLKQGKSFSEMAAPQEKAPMQPQAPVQPRPEVVQKVSSMTPQEKEAAKAALRAKLNGSRSPGGK